MNQEKFIQTLKTIGFPTVNKYSACDFDVYLSDSSLQQFLDYFCSFNEENLLTLEELNEYTSITPVELLELENLASNEDCINENIEIEQKEEEECLKDELAQLQKFFKILQKEKEGLREHQMFLSEEKAKCEATNINLRSYYDDYLINKLPHAEIQLSVTLKSISELVTELKAVTNFENERKNILPCVNLKDFEDYFTQEEKVINCVECYIQSYFQLKNKEKSSLNISRLSNSTILKDLHILKKSLKNSKISEYRSGCSYRKVKASTQVLKEYIADNFSLISEISSSQLSNKLSEEIQYNEKLKKKEALLISYLSNAVDERLEAQCNEIAIARSNEVLLCYRLNHEKVLHPFQHLLNQRARLEVLMLFFTVHQKHLENIKMLINQASCFAQSEEKSFLEKKQKFEESLKLEKVQGENYLLPDPVFVSANKILDNYHNKEMSSVTSLDFITNIEQLHKKKKHLMEHMKDNNNTLETLEKQYADIAKFVLKGKEYFEIINLEKQFATEINHLEILLTEVNNIYNETEIDWNYKNQLLSTKRNLKISRTLFVNALLCKEKFEKIIEVIKEAKDYEVESAIDK